MNTTEYYGRIYLPFPYYGRKERYPSSVWRQLLVPKLPSAMDRNTQGPCSTMGWQARYANIDHCHGTPYGQESKHCLSTQKSKKQWSLYIKGASALFAWHICEGKEVTVLTPPPPRRFHPSGFTSYQVIEEPILKGGMEGKHVSVIMLAHPDVKGAEDFRYQIWPVDKTSSWIAKFGSTPCTRCWREVKVMPLVHGANGQNLLYVFETELIRIDAKIFSLPSAA